MNSFFPLQSVTVTKPLSDMKDKPDWKMQSFHDLQWTGVRRPQTAVWRIPKKDARKEKYSKSAKEPVCSYEIQSPGLSSSLAFSFESNISSQVIDLHTSNGPHHGYCRSGSFTLPMDRKLPHIHSSTDYPRSNIWDESSLSLYQNGHQSPQTYLTSVEIKSPWYITVLHEKVEFTNFCVFPNLNSTDYPRSNIWDESSLSLYQNGHQSPQTYLTSVEIKSPWYITVLHEKERCLLKLGEEINRLSRYEVDSKRKDQIISTLRNEISQLQGDLQQTSRPRTSREEDCSSLEQMDHVSSHSTNGFPDIEEFSTGHDGIQEVLNSPSSHKDLSISSERNVSTISLAGSFSEMQRDSHSPPIEVEQSLHDDENTAHLLDGENIAQEQIMDFTATPEDQIAGAPSVDESEEISPILQKLQEEIEVLKKDYEISKGAISSLQKTIFSYESKLRKSESKKESLHRELVERGVQLQAMSNKFSSMREDRKHAEIMAAMEKEIYNLRQLASELKSEVSKRNDLIGDLKSDIQRLQKEILECQIQMRRQEEERNQTESKVGDLTTSEQQVRVDLEALQSKFERFRSKIIQAAYTAPGFKGPQVEVSDNEILETMQKIIAERSDFYQQLKQKGVKIPPLYLSETSAFAKQSSSTMRKKTQ
ncbi:PREDICTED: coiled-coil domain-containing protein 27 [Nanorana parkeri]|uniref:coiled-coil domain-containing protein 27 n=1 Tax=Nanorana parkeri TaxID=125878 RepID=UPI0008542F0C|nr:PREDICTED: coiled-coil domain-containing protein 27 [Nanorana parkeri]